MSNGDPITAGELITAQTPSVVMATDEEDASFSGDWVFQAIASARGGGALVGQFPNGHFLGADGLQGFASWEASGVVGFGGGFLAAHRTPGGKGVFGLGGAATDLAQGGAGVVGVGAPAGQEPNAKNAGIPGAGTLGVSHADTPGAIGICLAEAPDPQGVQTGVLGASFEQKGPAFATPPSL